MKLNLQLRAERPEFQARHWIAFDLATTCGYATTEGGRIVWGEVKLAPGRTVGARFLQWQDELRDLVEPGARPWAVAYEEVHRHLGTDAAHVYGGLVAILTAFCERHEIPYEGVGVGAIKKHGSGKGNAGKIDMILGAERLVRARGVELRQGLTDNEADAVCLLDYVHGIYGATP